MKNTGKFLLSGISGILFVLLIVLLRLVDVSSIGPEGTSIGFSHLNQFFFVLFFFIMLWYNITDWLGITAILVAFAFAVTGLVQLIKRRSLLKVDKEIFVLGGLYILVIGIYVLFEKIIINYRPVIMPGCTEPEASFPSSHTMIVCVIIGSAMILLSRYIKKKTLCRVLQVICFAIIVITVVGRLLSGVHWFTDILGGILISTALVALFSGITGLISHRNTSVSEEVMEEAVK